MSRNPEKNVVQQDTLSSGGSVNNKTSKPVLQLSNPSMRPVIDLERAQEIIRDTEQREQQIISQRIRRAIPVVDPVSKPSIETDPLLDKYLHIGCVRPVDFPYPIELTVLERYFLPIGSLADSSVAFPGENVSNAGTGSVSDTLLPLTQMPMHDFFNGTLRPAGFPSSVTVMLMFSLILFTWIKYSFGSNLTNAIHVLFNYRQATRLYEEQRESDKKTSFFMNVLFCCNTGIFITICFPLFGIDLLWDSYVLTALFFAFATGLIFAVKLILWYLGGNVFMIRNFIKQYIFNIYLFNQSLGLFLFPFIIVIPFVSLNLLYYVIYGAFIMIGIWYLLKYIRIFQMFRSQNMPGFYFILYLCTLEILPLLLFVKVCKILSAYLVI